MPDIESAFDEALAHHEAGKLDAARAGYRGVLKRAPAHAESLHLLGLMTAQEGDPAAGAQMILHAMALRPGHAPHHNSLALAYRLLGRDEDAVIEYRAAAAARPGSAEIHNNLAAILFELGQHEEAVAHYRIATECAPGTAEIWTNLGNALAGQGDPARAEACFRRAIDLKPDFAEALANYGRWLIDRARWAEAEAWLSEAVRLAPADARAWNNLGVARQEQGRVPEAEASYRRAVAAGPGLAAAHTNLGCLLSARGRTDEALACHLAAIEAEPANGAAWLAFCMAHLPVLYRTEAEIGDRRRDYVAALEALSTAAGDPGLARSVAAAMGMSQPFFLPYQEQNDVVPQALYGGLACRVLAEALPLAALARMPQAGERIRLGIVSGFFQDHTIFRLFLEGWLTEIDRRRFEVIGFHTGRTADGQTARAAALCDRFVRDPPSDGAFGSGFGGSLAGSFGSTWRRAVSDAAPHVLLYPEVGIDKIAGRLAAERLASVQCVAWGHPETTGMPTVDYFLSSDLMEPPGGDAHYTERLVRLPRLGLHYRPEEPPPPPGDRSSLGLDPGVPVYWSGQALYKYLPRYDAVFPRIAAAVGPCQFVFIAFAGNPAVTEVFQERLRRAFALAGMDAARYCVMLPPMPQERFVAAVGAADAILDTPGWSGGKSTLDCLAQNPAIVTFPGAFMRGRHTAAILRQIGCEATIADSLDDYVAIAARLGRDAEWRDHVRRKVALGKHRAYRDTLSIRALETFLEDAVARAHGPPAPATGPLQTATSSGVR